MKRIYTAPMLESIKISNARMIASSISVDGTSDGEARSADFEGTPAITDDTEDSNSWL
jgi:hypothetical protein